MKSDSALSVNEMLLEYLNPNTMVKKKLLSFYRKHENHGLFMVLKEMAFRHSDIVHFPVNVLHASFRHDCERKK